MVDVRTADELKVALKSDVDEITILDEGLAAKIRSVRRMKRYSPIALGVLVAAAVAAVPTGGASLGAGAYYFAATSAAGGTTASAAIWFLVATLGGILVIGIFTDWEEVEVKGVLKLKRKKSRK